MQLSARKGLSDHNDAGNDFNQYIMPAGDIDVSIQRIINLNVVRRSGKRVLVNTKTLQVLPTVTSEDALDKFLDWIESGGKPVVLVAHNGHSFDMRHLLYSLVESEKYDRASVCIKGFVDKLPMFRTMFHIKPNEKGSYLLILLGNRSLFQPTIYINNLRTKIYNQGPINIDQRDNFVSIIGGA